MLLLSCLGREQRRSMRRVRRYDKRCSDHLTLPARSESFLPHLQRGVAPFAPHAVQKGHVILHILS